MDPAEDPAGEWTPLSDPSSPPPPWPNVPEPEPEPDDSWSGPRPYVGRAWADHGAAFDKFIQGFTDSTTWQAMLAAGDVLFPGFSAAATSMHWVPEQDGGAARVDLPVHTGDSGLVFNLSRHVSGFHPVGPPAPPAPGVMQPYGGTLVIDTIDPRRYHRAVSGPLSPHDERPMPERPEGDETTGVVLVARLAAAGVRVADADALWRYAVQLVTAARPAPGAAARRVVRALRYVVFLDPGLGLGVCLHVDEARVPWSLLACTADGEDVRFFRV